MSYRTYEKENDIYFKYNPTKNKLKKLLRKIDSSNSPFKVLKDLNLTK